MQVFVETMPGKLHITCRRYAAWFRCSRGRICRKWTGAALAGEAAGTALRMPGGGPPNIDWTRCTPVTLKHRCILVNAIAVLQNEGEPHATPNLPLAF